MNATYRVMIEPDGKAFHGYVPALRGCHTWGKTIAETRKHLKEAVELLIESLQDSEREYKVGKAVRMKNPKQLWV